MVTLKEKKESVPEQTLHLDQPQPPATTLLINKLTKKQIHIVLLQRLFKMQNTTQREPEKGSFV